MIPSRGGFDRKKCWFGVYPDPKQGFCDPRSGTPEHRQRYRLILAICLLLLLCPELFCRTAKAQSVATSTKLIVTPGNVTAGNAVTLTATVSGNSEDIADGSVTFYSGLVTLGTVQLIGATPASGQLSGTAVLMTSFVPGSFSLVAKYNGTSTAGPSTSQTVNLAVSGPTPSQTSLTLTSTGEPYSFALTATGSGSQALLGTAELLDTTASSTLDTIAINASQLQSGLGVHGSYLVGKQPEAIVSADFNHDGIPDFAVANYGAGTVSILLGNASGNGFEVAQTLLVGNGPCALATADFNGDGVPDLAVVNSIDDTVVVFLGNPDQPGTFMTLGSSTAVGWSPVALTVNDFNGDGILDIAVANYWDNSVTVLLGSASDPGKFTAGQTISVGQGPIAIASADFNGDGIPDLAIANFNDNTVWVLTGDPQQPGQFVSPKYVSATGHFPTSLAVADFNNDGIPDLAVSNSGDGTVSVLWGMKGLNGVFPTQQILTAGSDPESVTVGDFNGDGIPDIAVSNAGDGTIAVLLNGGGGRFQNQQTYPIGTGPRQVITWPEKSGQSPGLASVDFNAGLALTMAEGSTFTGAFTKESISGTGIHRIEAMYLPSDQSPYGKSTSNAIALNLGPATQLPQTITFPILQSVTYGAPPVSLMASASSSLPISYKVISGPGTIEGSTLAISGAGNVVVEADQSGNGTYLAAPSIQQTVAVDKAPLTVTPANASRYFGRSNPDFTGTIAGVISGDNITATYVSGATTSTPVGVYSEPPYGISATIVDPSNRMSNYAVTTSVGTLTIQPPDEGILHPISPPIPIPIPPVPIPIDPTPEPPVGPTPVPPSPTPIAPINPVPLPPIAPIPIPPIDPGPVQPVGPTPIAPNPIPIQPIKPVPMPPIRPSPIQPIEPGPIKPIGGPPLRPISGPIPIRIPIPIPNPISPIVPLPPIGLAFDALGWSRDLFDGAMWAISKTHSYRADVDLYLVVSSQVRNPGDTVTLTAAAHSKKRLHPEGDITFWDGHHILKAAELDQEGRATVSATLRATGIHVIRATYSGDDDFRPASTPPTDVYVFSLTPSLPDVGTSPELSSGSSQLPKAGFKTERPAYPDCSNALFYLSCSVARGPSACSLFPEISRISLTW